MIIFAQVCSFVTEIDYKFKKIAHLCLTLLNLMDIIGQTNQLSILSI